MTAAEIVDGYGIVAGAGCRRCLPGSMVLLRIRPLPNARARPAFPESL